jgi:hypothetical protein
MGWLMIIVVIPLILGILANDISVVSRRTAKWIVAHVARRLPIGLRDRYEEEWSAHLAELLTVTEQVWFAFGCAVATLRLALADERPMLAAAADRPALLEVQNPKPLASEPMSEIDALEMVVSRFDAAHNSVEALERVEHLARVFGELEGLYSDKKTDHRGILMAQHDELVEKIAQAKAAVARARKVQDLARGLREQ